MGTRNLTIVQVKGKIKVAQYGQWDGYPKGQGKIICEFIQSELMDTKKRNEFKKIVAKLKVMDKKKIDQL